PFKHHYSPCVAAKVPLEPDMPVPVARPITATVMANVRHFPQQPHQPRKFQGGEEDQEQPKPAYAAQAPQGFPEPQGYGWGQLQQDMASLQLNQTEFFDSIQAQ
ncbi:hypothetical protein PIB30_072711, partial [Stylosanthes scabra]|nr:hypothetical protein [Stylosanthes scabra]